MGLTYALTSDRRTVLRTDFGVSYVEAGKGGGQLYKNLPFYFSQVISTDQNGAPPLRLSDGLPVPTSPNLQQRSRALGRQSERLGFQSEVDESHAVELRYPGASCGQTCCSMCPTSDRAPTA